MNPLTWIPGLMSMLSALAVAIYAIQSNRARTEYIEKNLTSEENASKSNFEKLELRINGATNNLSEALALIRVMQAEQSVINKVTAQTLLSITNKMSEHDEQMKDNMLDIKLLQQKLNEA